MWSLPEKVKRRVAVKLPLIALRLVFMLSVVSTLEALHISGTYNPSETFFLFLAKFGFQKTDLLDRDDTQGCIYGNISLAQANHQSSIEHGATLAVLDRSNFLEFYGNHSVLDKNKACEKMFSKINAVAYDSACYEDGAEDFLRSIPCPKDELCSEEDNPSNVIKDSQLTFKIRDLVQARFWYVSLVACSRNQSTCQWQYVPDFNASINYDLHLVNGNPLVRNKNVFKYQYSCDKQDLLQVYLFLLLVYSVLTPIQIHAAIKQKHPITRLLAAGLVAEFSALAATSLHFGIFAANGIGAPGLSVIGEILEIFSESMFMLLLLLLAMGWSVTRQELTCKYLLFGLWSLYTVVHCLLYIWMKTEVDVIEDVEAYQTIPGIITLILRIIVMVCFVTALKDTMAHEHDNERLAFFLHFGAASLVWFNYLPLMAIIALQISALWRTKFVIGIVRSVDTFAYSVIIHLLWPSRSQQYFLLAQKTNLDATEELEVLCQDANHLNESGGESGGEFWLHDQTPRSPRSPTTTTNNHLIGNGNHIGPEVRQLLSDRDSKPNSPRRSPEAENQTNYTSSTSNLLVI